MVDRYLTIDDVKKIADKPFNVLKFSEFKSAKSLEEMFDPVTMGMKYEAVDDILILYEMKMNSGHWCVLKRLLMPGYTEYYSYQFLDSYGEIIDEQRKHINKVFAKKSNQDTPNILRKLVELSQDANAKTGVLDIHYNNVKLQGPNSSTCGRYAGLFIRYDTTVENFAKQLKSLAKKEKISVDELVIRLTEPLLS